LTPSKVLPTYRPTTPKIVIIKPDKNHIDTIRLAYPGTIMSPEKYFIRYIRPMRSAKKETKNPALMVSRMGLSE
jgi:hypothetical protein